MQEDQNQSCASRHERIYRPQFVSLVADHDVIVEGPDCMLLSDCTRLPKDLSLEDTAFIVQLSAAYDCTHFGNGCLSNCGLQEGGNMRV
jgi:hypothetical protein